MQSSTIAMRASPLMAKAATQQRPARQQTVVRAMAQEEGAQSRRAALALAAAAVLGLGFVESAQANAEAVKSGSAASMSSFNMEGTKHMGISPKKRAKLMAKVRANAEKRAAQ